MTSSTVWIFTGARSQFPSAVFHAKHEATAWIRQHRLTGTLTEYPVGMGVFEWAIDRGFFSPTKPTHYEAPFIQTFSSAGQNHLHFDDGICSYFTAQTP